MPRSAQSTRTGAPAKRDKFASFAIKCEPVDEDAAIKLEPVDEDAGIALEQLPAERSVLEDAPAQTDRASNVKREDCGEATHDATRSTRKRKRGAAHVVLALDGAEMVGDAGDDEKKPVTTGGGGSGVRVPAHWDEVYRGIEHMRRDGGAPVDMMGCEILADSSCAPQVIRFQTLVSLMLSSQTKDQVTAAAVRALQRNLPGGLTIESVLAADEATLNAQIAKVGFHNRKTIYIKQTAARLRDEFGGDIPASIEALCSLPGVGPKMAHLAMQCAWGTTVGIGVDVHVHRICNRLGWVRSKTPEQTRVALESWLPVDRWRPINKLLVGFGQTVCKPVGPMCTECLVADLCPSAGREAKRARASAAVKSE